MTPPKSVRGDAVSEARKAFDWKGSCPGCGRVIGGHEASRTTFHQYPVCSFWNALVAPMVAGGEAREGGMYLFDPLTGKLEPSAKA